MTVTVTVTAASTANQQPHKPKNIQKDIKKTGPTEPVFHCLEPDQYVTARPGKSTVTCMEPTACKQWRANSWARSSSCDSSV